MALNSHALKVRKGVFDMKQVLLLIILSSAACSGIANELRAQINLYEKYYKALEASSEIRIYSMGVNLGRSGKLEGRNVKKDWYFQVKLRCKEGCSQRVNSDLIKILKSSIRTEKCGLDLGSKEIEFIDNKNIVHLNITYDHAGHCFEIGGKTYFSHTPFKPHKNLYLY